MKRWIKNIIILCVVCLIGVTAAIWVNVVNKEEVSGETIGINIVPVNSFVTEQDSEDNKNINFNREIKNIVCWGDSITYGLGSGEAFIENEDGIIDASDWAYTDALAYYTGMNVYNLGVCGETVRVV